MRPDIEDFEELNIPADEAPRSRAMSWLVLAVAVGGFGALAYYAYHSGTQSMQNGDVLVVEAESTPIKQVPENPEGEQFANQDKTIYEVIAPNAAENKVEQLLPEPEKPVEAPQEAASGPTTYVNKNLTPSTPTTTEREPAKPAEATKPAPLVAAVPSSTEKPVVSEVKPATTSTAPASAPKVAAPIEGEPTFVNESPVATVAKPVEKPAAKPAVKKEEKPKTVATASSGSSLVQLGAFKSEADAQAQWKKLSGKYPSVLTGSPSVQRAELPNGIFYRLRTSVSGSGKDACAKLAGVACMPVAK